MIISFFSSEQGQMDWSILILNTAEWYAPPVTTSGLSEDNTLGKGWEPLVDRGPPQSAVIPQEFY